jgi:hypothetical protein
MSNQFRSPSSLFAEDVQLLTATRQLQILLSNAIEQSSAFLERDPKSFELCSRQAANVSIPKPSGLGMVSCSTTSAASRKIEASR